MAVSASPSHPERVTPAMNGWLREIRAFWKHFIISAFNPYRPEAHYMRGPGPACRRVRAEAKRRQLDT